MAIREVYFNSLREAFDRHLFDTELHTSSEKDTGRRRVYFDFGITPAPDGTITKFHLIHKPYDTTQMLLFVGAAPALNQTQVSSSQDYELHGRTINMVSAPASGKNMYAVVIFDPFEGEEFFLPETHNRRKTRRPIDTRAQHVIINRRKSGRGSANAAILP